MRIHARSVAVCTALALAGSGCAAPGRLSQATSDVAVGSVLVGTGVGLVAGGGGGLFAGAVAEQGGAEIAVAGGIAALLGVALLVGGSSLRGSGIEALDGLAAELGPRLRPGPRGGAAALGLEVRTSSAAPASRPAPKTPRPKPRPERRPFAW